MKMTTAAHYLFIALGLFATNLIFAAGDGGASHGGDLFFPIPETANAEMEAHHDEDLGHELRLVEQ